ncbi:sulfite exporter TauE/SafE family protein [Nitrincola tibetensis]|nr:sulfite exporter TauE/SafE family protein [Nitrincola tibetensis]
MLMVIALYLALGAFAGLVAGLFGIGGGLIIVPVLIFSFEAQGMPVEYLTHMAVATSLATIVITSMSSVRAHHAKGAVDWPLFRSLTLGILVGAMLGVNTAMLLPGHVLQMIFGVFALLVALQMAFSLHPKQSGEAPTGIELKCAGGVIGWASSIFGIGGGTLSVPYLTWRRQEMRRAVATSAACGLPIAVMGALTNVWVGLDKPLPEWSLGYVYLPAFLGIVISSSLFAGVGARLAHKLPQSVLKKCFAAFLFVIAIRFLVVNWVL